MLAHSLVEVLDEAARFQCRDLLGDGRLQYLPQGSEQGIALGPWYGRTGRRGLYRLGGLCIDAQPRHQELVAKISMTPSPFEAHAVISGHSSTPSRSIIGCPTALSR